MNLYFVIKIYILRDLFVFHFSNSDTVLIPDSLISTENWTDPQYFECTDSRHLQFPLQLGWIPGWSKCPWSRTSWSAVSDQLISGLGPVDLLVPGLGLPSFRICHVEHVISSLKFQIFSVLFCYCTRLATVGNYSENIDDKINNSGLSYIICGFGSRAVIIIIIIIF